MHANVNHQQLTVTTHSKEWGGGKEGGMLLCQFYDHEADQKRTVWGRGA